MSNFKDLHNLCEATILFIALSLRIDPLQAQTATPAQIPILPQLPQVPLPLPPKKEPILKPPSPSPGEPEFLDKNQKIIKVKGFVFKGNTVFDTHQLEAVVAPYVGREITFTEMLQARTAVTKFYTNRGYITSGAFIPLTGNQSIKRVNGGVVVTIQVIEGKLESINVLGSSRLQDYVRSRLHAATSPVLNTNRLIEALRLLQIDPKIETISAELSEGSSSGKTLLSVRVKPRQPFRVEAILNNSRSPAIGSFERRVQVSDANLLGLGDSLSVGYRNTDGSNAVESSYSLPINPQNGTVQFSYINISSNIIERPFNKLDILDNARIYDLSFRQPIIRKASTKSTQEFALGLTATRLESEASLLQTPYPLSEGADSRGRTRISAIRFFQDWTQRSSKFVLFARSQFSLGIGAFNATINNTGPDSRFFAWRGQAAWLRRLGEASLILRADLQLADRALVPLEQFGLGGAATVRGYRQDAYLSDNGFLASASISIPLWKESSREFLLIPFVDVGTTWNNEHSSRLQNADKLGTLASVGLGVEYHLGDRFSARLDWGIPLIPINTNSNSNTWQEEGIYFNLQYRLF